MFIGSPCRRNARGRLDQAQPQLNRCSVADRPHKPRTPHAPARRGKGLLRMSASRLFNPAQAPPSPHRRGPDGCYRSLEMRVFLRTLALSGMTTAALAAQAHAAGFYLQEQSVRGTGRAYSGEVADQCVESLLWNPAAISRCPREAYVGASAILAPSRVENTGSTITYPGGVTRPVGGEVAAYNPIQNGVVPNLAVSTPIGDRFAVGVSLTAPFNLTTKYRQQSWVRYDALRSRLTTADLQLTAAMKVTDWLDLGVGFDAQHTEAKLQNALPNLSPTLPDGITQLSGNGWNYGWTVGAQAPFDRLSLGASYRSA